MQHELTEYILSHIDEEHPVLNELERYTYLNVLRPRMLSGHLQGSLLKMICRMINPENILEIGTYTGYSSICMAFGCHDSAHIQTIEINDELEPIIRKFYKKAGVENKISLHIGDALDILRELDLEFDMVFIDGDKRQYPEYYKAVFPKIKQGGFILADNILWDGKVARPGMPDDAYTKGIMDFNQTVKDDSRVEKAIIPVRDGITLIRKK